MITSRELRYVSSWANRIPMPGVEYSIQVLKEIKKCYELFNEKYKDKQYSIIFSNSDEIDFEIQNKNLCHMMGVDFQNIMGDYFNQYRSDVFNTSATDFDSFTLLELIIENMEKVAELDNDENNRAKAINYYKSAIKCAIFNRLSNFEEFNFGAINFKGMNENVEYDKQKILFVPSNEPVAPYFMMFVKDDGTFRNNYIVSSLNAPDDPYQYFNDQEVSIPTQILVADNNNMKKLFATPEEKLQLLTMYSNIVNRYNIPNKINIYGDYENMLKDISNKKYVLK